MDVNATVNQIDWELHEAGCPDGPRMKAVAMVMSALLPAERAAKLSRDNLQRELALHGYNVRETARAVGCHYTTVYRKIVA